VKEVRLSHIILVVGRVDVRVEDSRVRHGVESFKPFFFVCFQDSQNHIFHGGGGGGKGCWCFFWPCTMELGSN